ncbi:MAG: prepilin-type N-terminal cleavage/methylation domain-containing protein [Gemmatimonadota bacterium]
MTTIPSRRRAGFTLIELLIAMVVLSLVMASALSVFRSQSKNFRVGGTKMELTQNIRYAVSTVDRLLRTTGAGTAPNQPMFAYGSNDALVFNTNFSTDLADGNAVYVNPSLPAGAINSMTTGLTMTIPGTAIVYPGANYFWGAATPSRAETMSIYFRPDSSTPDPLDFVLLQRVNAMPSEEIARNIRAYPGRPFFEYWYDSTNVAGQIFSRQLAAARIPVRHASNFHGDVFDIGASALADSIRMIRINLVVTNGLLTADSSSRRLSSMTRIPNNGLVQLKTCGDIPILTSGLVAVPNLPTFPPLVTLTWNPSVDEASGERDVSQYNVYSRVQATPPWQPFATVAAGQPNYILPSASGLVVGTTYEFAVAAQDCSPAESALIISNPAFISP